MRTVLNVWVALWACLAATVAGYADQLHSRAFTTEDGLPVNTIEDILADSHGFLWFASDYGLTRFDGHDFKTFTAKDGLPSNRVTALAEGRDGTLWLGTKRQLVHFQPHRFSQQNAPLEFTTFDFPTPRLVVVIFPDRRGRIWCGTLAGLFLLDLNDHNPKLKQVPIAPAAGDPPEIGAISEDGSGVVWASFVQKLYRIPDVTRPEGFRSQDFSHRISSLLTDGLGRVWMGTWHGLYRLRSTPAGSDLVERSWQGPDLPSGGLLSNLFRSRDGKLWALGAGLTGWDDKSEKPQFHQYQDMGGSLRNGLAGMSEDPQGSLWGITEGKGVVRLSRNGLTRFESANGLSDAAIRDVIGDQHHNVIAVSRLRLNLVKNDRFVPIVPLLPMKLTNAGWGERQILLHDHLGEWWLATGQGVVHYPAVPVEALAHTRALALYSSANGLSSNEVFRLAEDSTGNIWIGMMGTKSKGGGINIWHRKTERLTFLVEENGPSELVADSHGSMWIGWWYSSGLQRYRNGHFQTFTEKDGLASGSTHAILFDHDGRMWVASTQGLRVVDHPGDEHIHFRRFAELEGLPTHRLFSLAEGANHRLYVGSENGLYEVDPVSGRVRHYGMADGLPSDNVLSAYCDSDGVLWFGTHSGLARLQPTTQEPDQVQLRFTNLIAGGQKLALSKFGETQVSNIKVDSSHNSFEVRFADLAFGAAGPLLYQYQVGPKESWSEASADRVLTFVGLAPGSYQVQVRAVDPLGHLRSAPISLALSVLPPIWRTWWFALILLAAAAAVVWLVMHYRIARILAVQQIRTRISSDLHDDIGSGLSQIAIWSDIALREKPVANASNEALQRIAASSRSLVDSIGDIVWTVNPRRDSLGDLLHRIRYFASEACAPHDIALQFSAPNDAGARTAYSMLRHDVFLLAKEAIHNAVRHSGATILKVEIEVSPRTLDVRITDNGKGMPVMETSGNGLQTMRQRAGQLGGRVEWVAPETGGTAVHFSVPLTGGR